MQMKDFKYLLKEENSYAIKKGISVLHLILFAWIGIGLALIIYSNYLKTGLILTFLATLLLVLGRLNPAKTKLFPETKSLSVSTGIRGKKPVLYSFSSCRHIDLQVIKLFFGLPIHATLFMHCGKDGNSVQYEIAASLSPKKMKALKRELEEIFYASTSN